MDLVAKFFLVAGLISVFSAESLAQQPGYPGSRLRYSRPAYYRPPFYGPRDGSRYKGRYSFENRKEKLKEHYSAPKVVERMESLNPAQRRRAAKELMRFPDDSQAREALEKALTSDPSSDVRWQAVQSLGRIKDPVSIAVLKKASKEDPNKQVREIAKWIAIKVEMQDFLVLIQSDEESHRKEVAKRAITLPFADPNRLARILAKVLCSDPSPAVRKEAAKSLGQLKSPMILSALNLAKKNEPVQEVRQEIEKSISNQ